MTPYNVTVTALLALMIYLYYRDHKGYIQALEAKFAAEVKAAEARGQAAVNEAKLLLHMRTPPSS